MEPVGGEHDVYKNISAELKGSVSRKRRTYFRDSLFFPFFFSAQRQSLQSALGRAAGLWVIKLKIVYVIEKKDARHQCLQYFWPKVTFMDLPLINKPELLSVSSRAHDTVGAVAVDRAGNVACATSTGGIRNKMVGRVGDSPVIGRTMFTFYIEFVSITEVIPVLLIHLLKKGFVFFH